ncbi:hypothetical protein LCGC14_1911310, partial [marine sediment metagenome]
MIADDIRENTPGRARRRAFTMVELPAVGPPRRIELPAVSRRKSGAFTMVELLIVIVIIGLLVTILMPTVGRVRDMARKVVCATTLHSHGVAVASYISANDAYPNVAPWPWYSGDPLRWANGDWDHRLDGWPKFYGVLETLGFEGTRKTNWGNWHYDGPIENIWKGSFCPSMDPISILVAANNAGNYGFNWNRMYWVWYHKWAIGYQWSPFLRSGTRRGRDPVYLKEFTEWDNYLYQWIMPTIKINDVWYCTQAAHPRELKA